MSTQTKQPNVFDQAKNLLASLQNKATSVVIKSAQQSVNNLQNNYIRPIQQGNYLKAGTNIANAAIQNFVLPNLQNAPKITLPQVKTGGWLTDMGANNVVKPMAESILNTPYSLSKGVQNTLQGIGNQNPTQSLQGLGQFGEGALNVATLIPGVGLAARGAKSVVMPTVKQGAIQGAKIGAGIGGLYGGTGFLQSGNYTLPQLLQDVGLGVLGGGVLGAGGGSIGGIVGKLTTRTPQVDAQLRDLRGRWVAGNQPIKPKGMPQAQWDFQLNFNQKYNRNPYQPVFPSDLQKALAYETEKRGVGLSIRDVSKDKNPLGQLPIKQNLVNALNTSKFDKISFGEVSPQKINQLNIIRQRLGQPVAQNRELIIPTNVLKKFANKLNPNMSADNLADILFSAVYNTKSKILETRYPHIQATIKAKPSISNVGFLGVDAKTGETVIKSAYQRDTGRLKELLGGRGINPPSGKPSSSAISGFQSPTNIIAPSVNKLNPEFLKNDTMVSRPMEAKVAKIRQKQSTLTKSTLPAENPLQSQLPVSSGDKIPLSEVSSNTIIPQKRGFISSVQQAEQITGKTKAKVVGTYTPKADKALMGEAQALLNEGASLDFQHIKNLDQKIAATIQEAINLDKAGEHTAAATLYNNLAEHGTELGRGVHAFNLLDKMSPEAVALSAAGKIKKYNLTHTAKIPELTGKQTSIIADRVNTIRQMADGREKNIAMHELNNIISDFIPSSKWDKGITVWKAGLLTSLRTHERNLIGNTMHQGAEILKDVPALFADKAMALVTGQRTTTFTTRGLVGGAKKGIVATKDIVTKGYDPEQAISKYDVKRVTWGNNPIEQGLKVYTEAVFRTLGGEDKPFWNAAFGRSLYDQAGAIAMNEGKQGSRAVIENLVKNPTSDMLGNATKDANVSTFHDTTKLSQIARELQGSKVMGVPVGQIIAPFTGVPSSIAGQMMAYSPLGLIKGAISAGRVVTSQIPELQRQAAQEIGRGVIGTGLLGIGSYLMQQGLMTGQPKDAQEAAQWKLENKPANSVLIGGQWRGIGSIGPENLILLAGAKLQQGVKNKDMNSAIANVGKDYMSQSFIQGMSGITNAISDPTRFAQSYIGGQEASVIPNIVKDIAKSQDPYQRELNNISVNPLNNDYIKGNLPLVRNTMLPKRDALGNQLPQEPTGIGAFIDLFGSKTPKSGVIVDELKRLNEAGQNATPSKISKSQTIYGAKTTLDPKQLDALEAKISPTLKFRLHLMIQSPSYQNLSDEDKAQAIDRVVQAVRKQVKGNFDVNQLTVDQIKQQLKALKTPQQRAGLIQSYMQKGIITPQILEQMRAKP